MKKLFILIFFLVLTIVLAALFWFSVAKNSKQPQDTTPPQTAQNNKPQVISTKPDPLENTIIGANDAIEITFNRSLENAGEFKSRIEPKIDYKVELSPDRKTAKIIPAELLELGSTYTIFIGTDTKFDGVGAWGQEKIYHFRTIKYTGV